MSRTIKGKYNRSALVFEPIEHVELADDEVVEWLEGYWCRSFGRSPGESSRSVAAVSGRRRVCRGQQARTQAGRDADRLLERR